MAASCSSADLQHLLDDFRAGDDAARDALLQSSLDRCRELARRMFRRQSDLRKLDETDDVLQKALLRLHGALGRAKPLDVRAFYGLAARQIRWVLHDLAREVVPAKVLSYVATPPEPQGACDEASDLLEWSEFHAKVQALPDEEREMFDLLFYQGVTQEEAAEVLNTSVRTVRRRWQRARLLLDRALHGEWPRVG